MKNISIHKNTFTRVALTLLVVFTMSLTVSATDFITDVMVAGHSNQTQFNTLIQNLQQEGWTDIDYDLNKGCGSSSYYIHLLYKKQSSSGNTGVPITDFYIRTGANPPDNLTYGGRTYYLVPCQGNDNFTSGHGDLNAGCGSSSDYIFLYYTKDALSNNTGITAITFNTTQSGAVGSNGGSTGYDLNSGAGGAYIYMHLTTATGANVVTLSSGSGNVPLRNGHILTGTGGTETQVTIADGATVTFNGVNNTAIPDNSSHPWPGISCLGNATIVLNGSTTNSVKGGRGGSGIHIATNKTLTIQGSGTLNATGGYRGAGIGGGWGISCGNITISGGTITANGGDDSAGIGSGYSQSSCGNITISGGTVTATGGASSAGIGSGYYQSSCGNITITNGVTRVTATKGQSSNNTIGAGNSSTCGTVTIGGVQTGNITMSPFVTYPYTVAFNANGGTGTMNNQSFMYNVAQNLTGNAFNNAGHQFLGWATSATGPKVYNNGQNVTNLTQTAGATVTLYAKWANMATLTSQIGEVLLQDGDTLTGTGGQNTRVKIADNATVTFNGVDLTALNNNSSWPGITCLGDAVIVLNGGTTNSVNGGNQSPGIYIAANKTLTIQGSGTLNATGGYRGAGIGSGLGSSCGNITISGGMVNATGGTSSAGIGSGRDNSSCGNITISGGTVNATGGDHSAGIGSGYYQSSCGNITITNGVTCVTVTKGQYSNNAVGAGNGSTCGTVTIGGVQTGNITMSPFVTYPYTVAFDSNGGTGTMNNQGFMYNVAQSLISNGFTNLGYLFDGWATSINGPKAYDNQQNVSNLTEIPGDNVTLFAMWDRPPGLVTLSSGSGEVLLQDGDILTGTGGSNTHVSIANGATVTFSDVDITAITNDISHAWPGITCLGDAVIVLADNTTNSVKGGYESPGIIVPEEKTVTIQGNGTLNATGSEYAAGIGGGNNASCGNITIANSVAMVTATKGEGCDNAIGAGYNSSCGTVTIGDVVTGFITQSPFTTFPYNVAFDANGGINTNTPIDIDFEDGTMGNWTQIDADGDGNIWRLLSELSNSFGHNNSGDCIFSQSFDNNLGILTPDNYFVSPQTTLGGIFTFWACAQDASWPDEHFGVAISTTGNTSASDFTTVQEWTMAAKSYGQPTDATRSGNSNQGTWYQYTVDLSSYAGQMGYIAIRHFNCTDFFWLDVDDITYTFGSNVIAVGDQVFMYNVAQNLLANSFSRTGFVFEGWATTADGPKVYDNEESVINLTETPGDTVTLYAKWHVPTPMGLTCTGVTPTSATLTWASEAASWQIMLNNDEQNLIDANAKPFTLTDLTPQTSYTVKVRGISDNTYSDWSDSQSFTTTEWQVVPAPTGLTCTSVTSTTATLTWSSEAASWQIMLNNDEQNLIDANVKPFILTGLAPNTTYTVKVRVLSSGTYSDWSDSQTFTTNKQGQQALPYAYSFENNNLSADGWRLQGASRNCTGIHNALAHTGSYLLRISFSENGVYLVSPIFTGGDNGIYMSFYYTEYDNMYGSEKFQVGYTTDETVTNPSNFTYGEVVTASTQWQKYSQIFPAGTKRIAIKYIHTRSWYLFLDDFLFKVPGEVSSFDLPIAAYTDNGGYHLIASPIADPITPNAENGFITTSAFDLYRFNQAANLEWENWKAEGTGNFHFNLESGRGYLYANQGGTTLTFTGTPYTGNGQVALTKTAGAQLEGWNLIGNPSTTEKTLAKPFYRMNSLGTEIIAAENNIVEAMEGIFVVADTDGEVVTFADVTRGNSQGEERIVLNLSGPSTGSETAVIDRAIIRFGEGQTLPKSQIGNNSTKLYIPQDGKDYAVVNIGRDAMHCVSTEIPINFKAKENGEYTLTISATLSSQFSALHLIDSLTGADVDLLTTPSYTFSARNSDQAARFKLVFERKQ